MNITQNLPWQAHVTVAVVIKNPVDDTYLCVEEICKKTGELVINQPAGHVEQYETLIQACVRETLEETGWHIDITGFLGIYTYQPFADKTFYRFCFIANNSLLDHNYVIDSDIQNVIWYSLADLQTKNNLRSPLVLKCIIDSESGKRFDLDIIDELLLKNQ